MQEMFVPSLIEIGQMFHFKRFFFQYTHVKIVSNSPLVPTLTLGDQNYLQYFRKLRGSCKYELFWLSGSQGKKINDLTKFS
jgi:hypothetical protein